MFFARWQHHLRFCSGFSYAPLKAMVTKISKWSRIQDSFRITPKIEPLVVFATPDISWKFQKDPSITFWVILLTNRQTDKQIKSGKNITSLAEVNISLSIWRLKIALIRGQNFHSSVINTDTTKHYNVVFVRSLYILFLFYCPYWQSYIYNLAPTRQRKTTKMHPMVILGDRISVFAFNFCADR